MDDFDHDHDHDHDTNTNTNSSPDNDHHENDDAVTTMGDADEMDVDREEAGPDKDDNEEDDQEHDEEEEDGNGQDPARDHRQPPRPHTQDGLSNPANGPTHDDDRPPSRPDSLPSSRWRPTVRPEALTAKLYDIVPTMAAPQATSINAIAITPDLRFWMTGGSDGYVRKYNGPDTINGKSLLTVAQRHPFVDSVVKAGVLMSYWENPEPRPHNPRGGSSNEDVVLSPVYSLAVHSNALWCLCGLESGSINLQSVRIDEGKLITYLSGHTNAVSVLALAPDEKSVLSGSWDKTLLDWDLNTAKSKRSFDGSGGQISALELRPISGAPFPPEASEEPAPSDTLLANAGRPRHSAAFMNGANGGSTAVNGTAPPIGGDSFVDAPGSDHESLFGGSTAGSLFGDDNTVSGGGGNVFGGDDDNEFSDAILTLQDGDQTDHGLGASGMGDAATQPLETEPGPAPGSQPPPNAGGPYDSQQLTNGNSIVTNGDQFSSFDTSNGQPPSQIDSTANSSQQMPGFQQQQEQPPAEAPPSQSPTLVYSSMPPPSQHDPTQTDASTFFSASIDGTIRIWDRRVQRPVARIGNRPGVPPWCQGACWSPDGNWIYAGRRNGTVEEFNVHNARGGYPGWQPERVLKFPNGSGAVSAVRPMANGRHLVCASYDILRLYDLRDQSAFKHSSVPFLIIPGPPRAGVISCLYIDPSSRFMITAAGTRGWDGSSTEVLIGYEISCVND